MNLLSELSKSKLTKKIKNNVKLMFTKEVEDATNQELYQAVVCSIRDVIAEKWIATNKTYEEEDSKVIYYLSMEFLMGRFLGNTLINLNMNKEVISALEDLKFNYKAIIEEERDPGLGNGGLGRLAACFLDSLSTLEYPAYGCGIRYHYGIFKQKIENGYQVEYPDNWLYNEDLWGVKRPEYAVEVKFGGTMKDGVLQDEQSVIAMPYDYPVLGYDNNTVNTLRLWDAEARDRFDLKSFNEGDYSKSNEKQNIAKILSDVLYPADEHVLGKELRIKQQYFFVSATIQTVIKKFIKKHNDFNILPEKVQFQLNDTHPSVAVAELMRILVDEHHIEWNEAFEITKKTCAYTNHTIMSEALEKWSIDLFKRTLPRIYDIIKEIDRNFCHLIIEKFGEDSDKLRQMAIISNNQVHMAYLAIVGSHSVNGVAQLHTDILKNEQIKDFYAMYPEKFNNKTNGITQRRWLLHCNPKLANLITKSIGDEWITNLSSISSLENFSEESTFQKSFMDIKHDNKVILADYINKNNKIVVDVDSIFDIQIKRLHEYKRQLLNIIYVMYLYNQIKENPNIDIAKRTFIFGAKASASYKRAKLIIKLINSVGELVNNDPAINNKIKVVFIENYCVSLAEKLIPACDVSEQISTASKEASGTGNMKFMLNGAITIGTLDGANVEMLEEVGEENIVIFGTKAEEIIKLERERSYNPIEIYESNKNIQKVLNQFIDGILAPNDKELFRELYDALLTGYNGSVADEYFVLKDFDSYCYAQKRINDLYLDKDRWNKMAIMNVAKSGKFSSDRTVYQYATEIWDLKPVKIK